MAITKRSSQKTKISFLDESISPAEMTQIPGVSSIGGPTSSRSEIDVSDLDSEAVEVVKGLLDNGEVSLDIFVDWENEVHQAMWDKSKEQTDITTEFEIEFPSATETNPKLSFDGHVMSMENSAAVNEALTASLVIRVSGEVIASHESV